VETESSLSNKLLPYFDMFARIRELEIQSDAIDASKKIALRGALVEKLPEQNTGSYTGMGADWQKWALIGGGLLAALAVLYVIKK
jgi:hypothetical protein